MRAKETHWCFLKSTEAQMCFLSFSTDWRAPVCFLPTPTRPWSALHIYTTPGLVLYVWGAPKLMGYISPLYIPLVGLSNNSPVWITHHGKQSLVGDDPWPRQLPGSAILAKDRGGMRLHTRAQPHASTRILSRSKAGDSAASVFRTDPSSEPIHCNQLRQMAARL